MNVATVMLTVARANIRPWEGRSGGDAAGVNETAAARDQLPKGPKVSALIGGRRDRGPYTTLRPVSPTCPGRLERALASPRGSKQFSAFVFYGADNEYWRWCSWRYGGSLPICRGFRSALVSAGGATRGRGRAPARLPRLPPTTAALRLKRKNAQC